MEVSKVEGKVIGVYPEPGRTNAIIMVTEDGTVYRVNYMGNKIKYERFDKGKFDKDK